jgi:beta-glucanase (GH16 family)
MKKVLLAILMGAFICSSSSLAALGADIDTVPAFEDNFDKDKVDETVWTVGFWKEHAGQLKRENCFTKDGMLNMILKYDSVTKTVLSSALQSKKTFLYGRWEYRAKISSVKKMLCSFYTIDWGEEGRGSKQEIDIEFLTFCFGQNRGKVHFAIHAAGKSSAGTNPDIELGFNPSDEFHIYGFEITPEKVEWFADQKVLYTYTYSDKGNDIKINSPYMLKLNTRGDSGWVQGPPKKDTDCIYLIDWIKFYPYKGKNK